MPETQDYDKSATPTAHQLDSAAFHTVSGLTPGHFLKATAPNAFAFAPHALTYSDVGADPAGAAAIVNGSLATHTALTTTAHGGIVASTDPRLSDSRTPLGHQLDGALHTVAGLTPGTFLKATGAATFGFAAHGLTYSDVGATPIAHKTTEDAINGLVFVNGAGAYSAKAIGTDVQAYNASLAAIAAGTWTGATSITTIGTIATGTVPQANVSGLTTASSPVFVTVKLSGLTDGIVPYHVSDATGLADTSLTYSTAGKLTITQITSSLTVPNLDLIATIYPALHLTSTVNNSGTRNWGIYGEYSDWGQFDIRYGTAQGLNPGSTSGGESASALSITRTGLLSIAGIVGIGTTTPAAKLAINGGLHVGGDSDPGDNNLIVDGTVVAYGYFQALSALLAGGDAGGVAGNLGLTNSFLAIVDSNNAVVRHTTSGAKNAGWVKAYNGTSAIYIPYWSSI